MHVSRLSVVVEDIWFGCIIFMFYPLVVALQYKNEYVCDSPSEYDMLDSSSLSPDILACIVVKVFLAFFISLESF